jgi:hypothetical protein
VGAEVLLAEEPADHTRWRYRQHFEHRLAFGRLAVVNKRPLLTPKPPSQKSKQSFNADNLGGKISL